ncbi:ethanolamine ammonia-lyase subunit EutC [uncultured Jatrophihabitans sp.]|uniref:ethanolamine ammonia-lyase subunit EutC n=1 Tax=uncultured Jatrophihabitans sp. TaxID=1610747 RepID=UPI0035CC7CA9
MSEPLWARLRLVTQARIGLGRAGNGLPTTAELEFRAAHAAARDAVHDALDVAALSEAVLSLGLGDPLVVASKASDRAEYLRRPDLGRTPAEPIKPAEGAELVVVLADGLSARAAQAHAVPLLAELLTGLGADGPSLAPPVIATQARVALGDHIGSAFAARAVLVLIGERPGLSVNDSLGAYLTYAPLPGRSDAERNCVSNIHPPNGMSYAAAARVIVGLLRASFELGESGVRVKDRTVTELPTGETRALG